MSESRPPSSPAQHLPPALTSLSPAPPSQGLCPLLSTGRKRGWSCNEFLTLQDQALRTRGEQQPVLAGASSHLGLLHFFLLLLGRGGNQQPSLPARREVKLTRTGEIDQRRRGQVQTLVTFTLRRFSRGRIRSIFSKREGSEKNPAGESSTAGTQKRISSLALFANGK